MTASLGSTAPALDTIRASHTLGQLQNLSRLPTCTNDQPNAELIRRSGLIAGEFII